MKVYLLSIYDVSKSGGLSTYVQNLHNAYKNDGDEVVVITPFTSRKLKYQFLISLTKAVYLLNKRYGLNLYYYILSRMVFHEFQKINTLKIDSTLHFQDVACLYYFCRFLNTPQRRILTLHGDLTNMNVSDKIVKHGSRAYVYSYSIERQGYSLADKIVAVDERLRLHAINLGCVAEKVSNFPNFTDISKFYPADTKEKKSLRISYGIPLDKKVIFCPRRLVKKNGVIYAVDVINILSEEYILIITGEGGERDDVLYNIREKGLTERIILTGDIPNSQIRDYYCLSDMVIIPSISSCGVIEATSISAIEGMACGVPVIASNIGGLAELIKDGENSFLAEEKNILEFSGKIEAFFKLPHKEQQKLSKNAVNSVCENFSSESYIRKIKNLIF